MIYHKPNIFIWDSNYDNKKVIANKWKDDGISWKDPRTLFSHNLYQFWKYSRSLGFIVFEGF